MFTNNFGDADLELGPNSEIAALDDLHPEADVENEENRVKVFTTMEGWVYRTGHGREKCTKTVWTMCGAELSQQLRIPSPVVLAARLPVLRPRMQGRLLPLLTIPRRSTRILRMTRLLL